MPWPNSSASFASPPHSQLFAQTPHQGLALTGAGPVTSTAHNRATGTGAGSLPMAPKLRGAGDWGLQKPPVSQGPPACPRGGCAEARCKRPGPKGSAGFTGYTKETQRTFESSFCTEPEIVDSWGNPSLLLPFLLNCYQAESAKPLGNGLITDRGARGETGSLKPQPGRFHIVLLHFAAGDGKNPNCKASRSLALARRRTGMGQQVNPTTGGWQGPAPQQPGQLPRRLQTICPATAAPLAPRLPLSTGRRGTDWDPDVPGPVPPASTPPEDTSASRTSREPEEMLAKSWS